MPVEYCSCRMHYEEEELSIDVTNLGQCRHRKLAMLLRTGGSGQHAC